jgi:hypothetical protein
MHEQMIMKMHEQMIMKMHEPNGDNDTSDRKHNNDHINNNDADSSGCY